MVDSRWPPSGDLDVICPACHMTPSVHIADLKENIFGHVILYSDCHCHNFNTIGIKLGVAGMRMPLAPEDELLFSLLLLQLFF